MLQNSRHLKSYGIPQNGDFDHVSYSYTIFFYEYIVYVRRCNQKHAMPAAKLDSGYQHKRLFKYLNSNQQCSIKKEPVKRTSQLSCGSCDYAFEPASLAGARKDANVMLCGRRHYLILRA